MLRVYYGSLPDEIYNTSVYFDNTYQDSWLSDPFVQEMIRGVDHWRFSLQMSFKTTSWAPFPQPAFPEVLRP